MKILKTLLPILLALLLTNCSVVVSKHPVGLENYSIKADEWNGTWMNDDGVIQINVTDESKGIIQLAWIEDKQNELKFESMTCQIMKGNEWLYINVFDEVTGNYLWGKITKNKKKIVFFAPLVEAFNEASEAGEIKSKVKKSQNKDSEKQRIENITLLDDPKNIVDLLEKNGSRFFHWDEPAILIKLKD